MFPSTKSRPLARERIPSHRFSYGTLESSMNVGQLEIKGCQFIIRGAIFIYNYGNFS